MWVRGRAMLLLSPALGALIVAAAPGAVLPAECAALTQPFNLVLDPGHDPAQPGALSARNRPEVDFNDRLAAAIARQLAGQPLVVTRFTRQPEENLLLDNRAARIEQLKPDLALSIHHDSVQPRLLRSWSAPGGIARYCDDYIGYSLFAPRATPGSALALAAAQTIGRQLLATGYRFSSYHALPIAGEGRAWLDVATGVYDGNYLFLLRTSQVPIVLLEAGFIINRESEQRLADPLVVEALARTIAAGVCRHAVQHERGAGRQP